MSNERVIWPNLGPVIDFSNSLNWSMFIVCGWKNQKNTEICHKNVRNSGSSCLVFSDLGHMQYFNLSNGKAKKEKKGDNSVSSLTSLTRLSRTIRIPDLI